MQDKGIFIKWDFWRDKDTTLSEKGILIEINNLSMLDKGCIAHNEHFAELMGIKKEAASRLISSLEKKGYITTKIKKGSRNFNRTITINKMLSNHKQNVITPLTNCLETKENKTINKTYSEDFINLWKFYNIGNKYKASQLYIKYLKENKKEFISAKKILKLVLDMEIKKDDYHKNLSTILNKLIKDKNAVAEEYQSMMTEEKRKETNKFEEVSF